MVKTAQELKESISQDIIEAGKTLLTAKAYVETIRPVVEGYQKEILNNHQWHIASKWTKRRRGYDEDSIILDPDHSYLLEDKDAAIYYEELHKEHLKHGFKVKKDYCPLLIAQNMERKARDILFDLLQPITGIDPSEIYQVKHLNEYERIALEMIVNHDNFI